MGNCQAIDAATLVVQHPCGKVDKFYWSVSAGEIMRMNPGQYVALLISTTLYNDKYQEKTTNPVRLTRIKLLHPTDTLVLGQVYRLITTQEVMKGLCARKHAEMKKKQQETVGRRPEPEPDNENKLNKHERHRPRSITSSNSAGKSKTWQPSLQSISEVAT